MAFGTSGTDNPDNEESAAVSKYFQSVWVAFAKDPENALTDQFGWPVYNEGEDSLVRLGWENSVKPNFVRGDAYDGPCKSAGNGDAADMAKLLKYVVNGD